MLSVILTKHFFSFCRIHDQDAYLTNGPMMFRLIWQSFLKGLIAKLNKWPWQCFAIALGFSALALV